MLILAIACLVLNVVALIFNLKESYDSHCGAIGQIPVLAGSVIQLPLLTVLGVSVLEASVGMIHFSIAVWMYVVLWLVCVVVYTALTILAGRLGEYVSERK